MKKILHTFVILSFLVSLTVTQIYALTIDSIGSSATTNGNPGTEWWYSTENPTLTGTAAASSAVVINIDGVDNTVTAATNGNWSFTPTTLTTGDHTVAITGDGQTMTFTLHAGQSMSESTTKGGQTASVSAETLPVTGAVENTLMMLGLGTIVILGGWKLNGVLNKA